MKIKSIIKELKDLEELTIRCMKCGTCQAECPVYQISFREPSVARGKIALIESVFEGRLEKAELIYRHLDYCAHCGRCRATCPSGVKTDEIFFRAKHTLRKIKEMGFLQKAILTMVMKRQKLMSKLSPFMHAGMVMSNVLRRNRMVKGFIKLFTGNLLDRNVTTAPARSFSSRYAGWNRALNEKMQVIFYPGCAINFINTDWGEAIVETLRHLGVTVYVPPLGNCCGMPAATMGSLDFFDEGFHAIIDEFENLSIRYVITACPTCQYALHELGPSLTGRQSELIFVDILTFLDGILDANLGIVLDSRTALHVPCHYQSDLKEGLANIINGQIQSDFIPLENQGCCGFGGTFNLKNYGSSLSIALKEINEVKEKNIQALYAPCPGCAIQLADAAVQAGASVTVVHPIVLIHEELKKHVSKNQP